MGKTMLRACLLILLTRLLSAHNVAAAADAKPARPNIVIIVCDDMGFSDLGCFGSEIDTPNLDALAANGLRFTDFHNNAKCSETRASLLTGLWHQQSKNLKKAGHVTLAEVLGRAGYSTMMSGKWHVAGQPRDRGFDRYFGFLSGAINFYTGLDWGSGKNLMRLDREVYNAPDGFYSTNAFTDYAIEFMDEANETPESRLSVFETRALPAARSAGRHREVPRPIQRGLGRDPQAALRQAAKAGHRRRHLAAVRA